MRVSRAGFYFYFDEAGNDLEAKDQNDCHIVSECH